MPTILVVEDDVSLCNTLVGTLEDDGYTVLRAESGHQAVELARQGLTFDLVVTDVRMAGIDGITAFEELRRLVPLARGIVITGYASEDAPTRALQAGVWDYLYKPFRLHELLTAVERVLKADEANEERNHQLASWWAGARNWLQRRAGSGEGSRHRAYWGFHTGVRSKLLDPVAGLAIWDELERAEQAYQKGGDAEELFLTALQLIAEPQREAADGPRRPNQVSKADFEVFFGKVVSGQIPGHLLPLAPFLRYVGPHEPAEVRRLAASVWG